MANKKNKDGMISVLKIGIIIFTGAVCAVLWWCVVTGFEGKPPELTLESPRAIFGSSYTLKGVATDGQSGLKRIWIAVIQEGREVTVLEQSFPYHFFSSEGLADRFVVSAVIDPHAIGLKDGQAVLRISIWDHSLKGWGNGNQYYEEKPILIDRVMPAIETVSTAHYLNQGGAGLAVFKVFEDAVSAGVHVGDRFFEASPAPGLFRDPNVYLCYFAVSYDQGPETAIYVTATDLAGNTGKTRFTYLIKEKTFKKDQIPVTQKFLENILPNLPTSQDTGPAGASSVERFLSINRDMRYKDGETISRICSKSDRTQHWSGAFLRLPDSAQRAGFGDHRFYSYNNAPIDEQFHLGIDLASLEHSPVPASNNGRIAFVGNIGIYGNTVIIDHGFFIFSMYSHLDRPSVAENTMVSKGDIIGITGQTGMAAGDHLHFAMLIAQTFVNPIEWWDPHWIQDNVTGKLDGAKGQTGPTKEAAQ